MFCPRCSRSNLPGIDQCASCLFDMASIDIPVPRDRIDASLMGDLVSILGPKPPVTVPRQATLGTAMTAMIDRGVGAVLVTDGPTLVGILTERDFLTRIAGEPTFADLSVERFMTPRPVTVRATDSLAFALRSMDDGGYRHLPVVADGVPVGVVSVRDVLRHVTRLCKDG